jgi:hypothetical protein
MDEKKSADIKPNDSLPSADSVYRVALRTERELDENGNQIPKIGCFTLSADDIRDNYRLSVEWNRKTTPEEVLIRVGTSFKKDKHPKQYKPFENRILYKLEVCFLKQLSFISDVIYTPSRKNIAHSSICFDNRDYNYEEHIPEILTELRDHAKQFTVDVNIDEVKQKVEEIRNAAQGTHLGVE